MQCHSKVCKGKGIHNNRRQTTAEIHMRHEAHVRSVNSKIVAILVTTAITLLAKVSALPTIFTNTTRRIRQTFSRRTSIVMDHTRTIHTIHNIHTTHTTHTT